MPRPYISTRIDGRVSNPPLQNRNDIIVGDGPCAIPKGPAVPMDIALTYYTDSSPVQYLLLPSKAHRQPLAPTASAITSRSSDENAPNT